MSWRKKVETKQEKGDAIVVYQARLAQSDLLKHGSVMMMTQEAKGSNPGNPAKQPSPATGGPQFGPGNKGGWGEKFRGWINKYGSSVILPVIALLILAGGIYLYASQKTEEVGITLEEGPAALEEALPELTEEAILEREVSPVEEATGEIAIEEIIPEARKEGGLIIEKAAKGDGVTHLARRALKDYLEDNPQELTNEHKIYIEDYLKDQIGSRPLEAGEEIPFSEDLINEAINASEELTEGQLKNLEKYSALVVSW